ncbi:MAG: DUF2306 domain-containing protein [Steroidobacteraceae bacterium]
MTTESRARHSLGFDAADIRSLTTMALGALVIIPTAAYLAGGLHFGQHDWQARLDLAPLYHASVMVLAHIVAALSALGLGIYVLFRRKGGIRHRLAGRVWAFVMFGVAITGMAIEPFRFTYAHGAALLVFVMVPLAIYKVRHGDLRAHRRTVAQLLIALVIVGLLALLPGQFLHRVFFTGG